MSQGNDKAQRADLYGLSTGGANLRDQFAMAAIPAVISTTMAMSKETVDENANARGIAGRSLVFMQATVAYDIADAMLEVSKTPGASTATETPKDRRCVEDGRSYTSNPPQSRCRFCGTFWVTGGPVPICCAAIA